MPELRIAVEGLYATEGTEDGGGRFLTSLLGALGRRDDVQTIALVGPSTHDAVQAIPGLAGVRALGGDGRSGRLAAQHVAVPRAARGAGADALLCLGNYAPLLHALPTVAVVQNMLLAVVAPEYGRARALYRRFSAHHIARSADRIVAVSRAMADELERSTPRAAGRVEVVPAGVETAVFAAPADPPGGAPRPYLIAVGTAWAYRDYELALGALARSGLPHTLVVAGGAAPADRERLEAHARALGLGERLTLLGSVPRDVLRGWYAGADALVATSRLESFALSVLEAMAAGVPVVAVRRTVYPETVGAAGELADADPDALAAALARALEPERRAQLAAAGRERAAEFSWERCAEALIQVCRTASAAPAAGRGSSRRRSP
jgi:glycosyltransferase involved in cell wall biosynthesis